MYEYLQIGKIVNTHGVKGDVRLIPLTDDPHRFDELERVFVEKDGTMAQYKIAGVRYAKGSVVLKLSGIDTIDEAEALRNSYVLVDRKHAVKLPENSFFICDIVGSEVYDENGRFLGKLTEVLQTGSNDVYVIKSENGGEILLPALKSVVRRVSVEQGRIDVTVPKGLLNDEV